MSKFEVYKDKAGEFRFRYRARNGEIMFGSEGYTAKASAMDAIDSIKKNVADAKVDDLTAAKAEAGAAAKPAGAKPAAAKSAAAKPKAPKDTTPEPAKG